ncbi:hypothetical protein KIN20_030490 [Parelaphostrongylus tenuis]|uniref:Uncharacterized protein n=1 Tax=Parelaphostrongylus tenuis TaxID=148309 RepID=A0AAD5WGF1_PARTN|nr:hypothetical protein KIN20_030490 [Parelaphostrongylus tenuis]
MISLLAAISTVLGCGVVPAGQASNRPFTVTGFTLPVAMAYAVKPEVYAGVSGIATSETGVKGFVDRLVMQTVSLQSFDISFLERQAHTALLPVAVISTILGQLIVTTSYQPLLCQRVVKPSDNDDMNTESCIVVDNTVTGICPIGNNTTNIIMVNWSRMMWQFVVNRAVQMLASDPFGLHFCSAAGTVGGN